MVNNIHVGGGVSHGPQMRSYREAIPAGMARKALALALAKRVEAGCVFKGTLSVPSGKTKEAAQLVAAGRGEYGKTLVVLDSPSVETIRAFRNLRGVVLVSPEQVTALDIMETRSLVTSDGAWALLEGRLAKKKTEGGARP
jgi:large subunit ribosomal protein L4